MLGLKLNPISKMGTSFSNRDNTVAIAYCRRYVTGVAYLLPWIANITICQWPFQLWNAALQLIFFNILNTKKKMMQYIWKSCLHCFMLLQNRDDSMREESDVEIDDAELDRLMKSSDESDQVRKMLTHVKLSVSVSHYYEWYWWLSAALWYPNCWCTGKL